MLRVEFLWEQTLIVGVSTQEVNLGKALGKSTCESKGKKAGLGRGRNPTARQSPGSAPADAAVYTHPSLRDVGAPGRGHGHRHMTLLT